MSAVATVLVVDDDVMVRDVGRYLGRAGYHVTVAGNGEEALLVAETAPPDLVMLAFLGPAPGLSFHPQRAARAGLGLEFR